MTRSNQRLGRAALLRGGAALALLVGYAALVAGETTLAPLVLVAAYVVLVPLALLAS